MTELGLTAVVVGKEVLCPGSINQPVTDTGSKQPGNNTNRIGTPHLNRGGGISYNLPTIYLQRGSVEESDHSFFF